MTDIIQRLHDVAAMDLRTGPIPAHTLDTAREAADEIKRLCAALKALLVSFEPEHEDWANVRMARAAIDKAEGRSR